jgi:hypothetical protein
VTVIGIGTLGGFLCRNISELDSTREIIIVDHDIVEGRNVFKSIYNSASIGEYKVDALSRIIEEGVAVTKIKEEYIEGVTLLPKSDLVIDCRDIVCSRGMQIDVRFYISDRTLMIDCRKNVQTSSYSRGYSINLTKNEIRKAAFFASQVIESNQIENMIVNNLVQRIDLNILKYAMSESIEESVNNKIDMIYEASDGVQRLHCIEESVTPILELNQKQQLDIFVGERPPIASDPFFNESKHSTYPQSSLTNSFDVIKALTKLVSEQPGVSNFIVTVKRRGDLKYVELLEETGAA